MSHRANLLLKEAVFGAGLLASAFAMAFRPDDKSILIGGLAIFAVLVRFLFCVGFCLFKKSPRSVLFVYLAAFLLFVPAARFGVWTRNTVFIKRLPAYEAAEHEIEAALPQGTVPIGRVPLPMNYRSLAIAATGGRSADGVVTVEFVTAGHFPVSHSGYLFCSDGSKSELVKRRWRILHRINPKWFYFSD